MIVAHSPLQTFYRNYPIKPSLSRVSGLKHDEEPPYQELKKILIQSIGVS